MSLFDSFFSLGRNINKSKGKAEESEIQEGVVSEKYPELTLDIVNDEILRLTKLWEKSWVDSEVRGEWVGMYEEAEKYWLGKQHNQPKASKARPLVDNVIFEALETYLPQVTRRNPEPMVELSRKEKQTPENLMYAKNLQKELGEVADEVVLRLKLKKAARHHSIYLLGCLRVDWNVDKDIPTCEAVRPTRIILDPEGVTDEDGYSGDFVGFYKKMSAGKLISMLENFEKTEQGAIDAIKELAKDSAGNPAMGTQIRFIEWWTDEYLCWTLGGQNVLMKMRNPHWDYGRDVEAPYLEGGEPQLDEQGNPMMIHEDGINHLERPQMPFIFLSIYNLGKQPVDETSLIVQNLASQDLINKRIRQIDRNTDDMNAGIVVSLERSGLSQQQARRVTEALRNGGTITIPAGVPREAIDRMNATSLPGDVFGQLNDTRIRVRDIFGTRGSSAAGLQDEKTVRGKIQHRILDTDRIGGGFSEYLEQMADKTYNWFVQMFYIYDERYSGKSNPKVRISVKEGSLLPKDSITMANQAIELAGAGRMSVLDLYKALDYPNPEEMAANVWLEANAPEILFQNDQRIQRVMQQRQQAQPDKPNASLNYKDLPPEGQSQLANQVGINLDPVAIAAYEAQKKQQEAAVEANKDIMKKAGSEAISSQYSQQTPQ